MKARIVKKTCDCSNSMKGCIYEHLFANGKNEEAADQMGFQGDRECRYRNIPFDEWRSPNGKVIPKHVIIRMQNAARRLGYG